MTTEQGFGLAELVRRSGVPAATIRHYVNLGLLPRPRRTAANRFSYGPSHLEALTLVRVLRDRRHLPLERIRQILPDLMADLEQAFHPDAWEAAIERRLGATRLGGPAGRLLDEAVAGFNARGYADVTIDDLCSAAGLAKGSFYRYYPSKEDLFFAVVDHLGGETVAALEQAAKDAEGRLTTGAAAAVVAATLGPYLPIVLELVARMAQRRPGYPRVGRQMIGSMADAVGRLVGAGADPAAEREAGMAVLAGGLALSARDVVMPAAPRVPTDEGAEPARGRDGQG